MSKANDQQKLQKAFLLHQAGNLSEAASLYQEIISRDPQNSNAAHYLGVVEASFRNFEQAKSLMARSLAIQPSNIQFIENYASLLFQLGDYNSALQACRKGLQLSHANVPLLYVCAISLFKLRRFEDSISQLNELLSIQPNHIAALNERGSALGELKRYDAALASVEEALARQPNYAEAYLNKGNLFSITIRFDEAIAAFDKALALKPELAEAWLGRGNTLRELKRYDEAFAAFDKALALKPDLEGAWLGRANVFFDVERYDEAIAAYDKALVLEPDLKGAEGARLHSKMSICDWKNFETDYSKLALSIKNQKANTNPFFFLGVSSSPEDQLQCARLWVAAKYPAVQKQIWQGDIYKHEKIRIAYVSPDLRQHAVSYLTAGMFECHDKSKFEVTAISLGPDDSSEIRQRLRNTFAQFIDATALSDDAVASRIRNAEIDVLVDLAGFTLGARCGIFARRPAPVQVSYLGWSSTMGASYIDYIIADSNVIPQSQQKNYSEKIAFLPGSYMPHDDLQRAISTKSFDRAEFGLPEGAFVFCCFNNAFKLNPRTFEVWMAILKKVDGSVLWLSEINATAVGNLRNEAVRAGIDPARLIFAKRLSSSAEHLARHRLADLFLDTLPYNAHTTASDALWTGLPVLTQIGEAFAGRVAASLLNALGLPELITSTQHEYAELAIELATNSERLATVQKKLWQNRLTTGLFDTRLFTRHIEAAYIAMYERYQAGLHPDNVYVPRHANKIIVH
jgi:protein O-GlcNAc transferase